MVQHNTICKQLLICSIFLLSFSPPLSSYYSVCVFERQISIKKKNNREENVKTKHHCRSQQIIKLLTDGLFVWHPPKRYHRQNAINFGVK